MNNVSDATPDQLQDPDFDLPMGQRTALGLQHVLAMFASNVTPSIIIAGAAGFAENHRALENRQAVPPDSKAGARHRSRRTHRPAQPDLRPALHHRHARHDMRYIRSWPGSVRHGSADEAATKGAADGPVAALRRRYVSSAHGARRPHMGLGADCARGSCL